MATVLITWELGGGLGHLAQIRPVAKRLAHRGHRVVVAAKPSQFSSRVLDEFQVIPAPCRILAPKHHRKVPATFAQILYSSGFGDLESLRQGSLAWSDIFEEVRPDVLLFDHSPTALLASQRFSATRMLMGMGFAAPPPIYPFPDWRHGAQGSLAQLQTDERTVLANVNQLLESWEQPPLAILAELFQRVDDNLLLTFPEMDHYGERPGMRYWGGCSKLAGQPPAWPSGRWKKVFAYLKPCPALSQLLRLLTRWQLPTLIYGPEIPPQTRQEFQQSSLVFSEEPVDLQQAGRQCDLAIVHGTHGTTAAMLLAGKPLLVLPLLLEQSQVAHNVRRMNAGVVADARYGSDFETQLQEVLLNPLYAAAAEAFARRYANFDQERQFDALVSHIESQTEH